MKDLPQMQREMEPSVALTEAAVAESTLVECESGHVRQSGYLDVPWISVQKAVSADER